MNPITYPSGSLEKQFSGFPFALWMLRIAKAPWNAIRWLLLTRPIRFTRFGIFYILFSLAVGAAAINTGNNLLYLILGILLGFIVFSGILSDSGLWHLSTVWDTEQALYVGKPAAMAAELRKERFLGMGITVNCAWDGATPETTRELFFWVPSKASQHFHMTLTPLRRGWLSLRSTRYSTQFPFGLFEKFHESPRDERWVVFPKIRRLPAIRTLRDGLKGRESTLPRSGHGSVPFQLRDFRVGDSVRHVHWKSSAKRQRLMVHDMEAEASHGNALWIPQWPEVSPEAFEALISFVASALYSFYLDGRPVALTTPETDYGFDVSQAHLFRMFRYLALIDQSALRASSPRPARPGAIDMIAAWREAGSEG